MLSDHGLILSICVPGGNSTKTPISANISIAKTTTQNIVVMIQPGSSILASNGVPQSR
jgi:hypothetical protein